MICSFSRGKHRVDETLPTQDLCAVGPASQATEFRDRLVRASLQDLHLGRHRIADEDRSRVIPLLVQEDAAGSWEGASQRRR